MKPSCLLFMSAVAAAAVKSSITFDGRRKLLLGNQPYPRPFVIFDYSTINSKLLDLADRYPNWIKVTTAQDSYGLPRAGEEDDCASDEGGPGCLNYILTVQDYNHYPEGSEGSNKLPEVFWSGALHGDERVGPTSVTEAVILLVEAAYCESLPSVQRTESNYTDEFETAIDCRETFQEHGISDIQRQWLARLATTRRLVVMPSPNSLGYSRGQRREGNVDANRDFPFDNKNPQGCMQTIAARSINEVFREHMFQLALTFHAGTEVIGYEWGAPTYLNETSPDDAAQRQIAQAYSQFAGSFGTVPPYPYGDMNTMVYFVRGGMEDWAYAGSWDTDRVLPCEPTTFGGYPRERTIYNDSMLRVYNMLIETSDRKTPKESRLGTTESVLSSFTAGNGHISRNTRLALLSLELVEPYVYIVGVDNRSLQDPVFVQHQEGSDASTCFGPSVAVSSNFASLTIEWSVGGALEVAETSLYVFTREAFGAYDCSASQMPSPDLSKASSIVTPVSSGNGTTQWHPNGVSPLHHDGEAIISAIGPVFISSLDVSTTSPGDSLVVIARARLDPSWAETEDSAKPEGLGPQAHIVQARSNKGWHHESGGKLIDGREVWFSRPILLEFTDTSDPLNGHSDLIVESTNRFDLTTSSPTSQPTIASEPSVAPVIATWAPTHLRGSNQTGDLTPTLSPVTDRPTEQPSVSTTAVPSIEPSKELPSEEPTELMVTEEPSAEPMSVLETQSPVYDNLFEPHPEDETTGMASPDDNAPTSAPDGSSKPQIPEWNVPSSTPAGEVPAMGQTAESASTGSSPFGSYFAIIIAVVLAGTGTIACIYVVRRREMAIKRERIEEEEPEEELVFNRSGSARWSFRGVFDSSWYTGQSGGMAPQLT